MLVLGVLASGTGTGLAVSGVSDSGSAGDAQYRPAPGEQGSREGGASKSPDVLGKEEGGDAVAGAQQEGGAGVQPNRQISVQNSDDSLAFTGLAAIPLILMGMALLVSGVVLRRRLPERT